MVCITHFVRVPIYQMPLILTAHSNDHYSSAPCPYFSSALYLVHPHPPPRPKASLSTPPAVFPSSPSRPRVPPTTSRTAVSVWLKGSMGHLFALPASGTSTPFRPDQREMSCMRDGARCYRFAAVRMDMSQRRGRPSLLSRLAARPMGAHNAILVSRRFWKSVTRTSSCVELYTSGLPC
ncbi:hypothetical protein HYPSUDRAFT_816416 [Hypholoma sublateritium FD-334 SS-4]|uniref:Uncharacterized protein n=1 Tax=Hypholoma sublateritium (strain FD-334 SS-4) TaxID=945553 RepID=A0A0D2NNB4_HYPSF|nr:hypothetical protein HYPSUDRAFT_816416 [Hypholoma sublateritium FD-334 SS-4]